MSAKNPAVKSPPKKIVRTDNTRCTHINAANRRCTGLRAKGKYGLCTTHATEERQLGEAESIAQELLGGSTELNTTIAINHILGKLFKLTAANRIPQRNAALLAYIGQLLLYSVGGVKQEFMCGHSIEAWDGKVQHAIQVLDPTGAAPVRPV